MQRFEEQQFQLNKIHNIIKNLILNELDFFNSLAILQIYTILYIVLLFFSV